MSAAEIHPSQPVEGPSSIVEFSKPGKQISNESELGKWPRSEGYRKYLSFIRRINDAVIGVSTASTDFPVSQNVKKLIGILDKIQGWIGEYPPEDMGAQRFGNKAYRSWSNRLISESEPMIREYLPSAVSSAAVEVTPYFLDAFGNSTRIDYGSGHELNFLIFLFCLYELNVLDSSDDRAVVLRVFHRYLKLVRHLQADYRMEPAGSRGVHAIDDFQFAPFIFGSAQLINNTNRLIPDYYLRQEMIEMYQDDNLFFEAIQYILKTKTGQFFEHSNQLYNISAVQTWEKINDGMFRMYEAEVLKKFPVVQHLLFGRLFSFKEARAKGSSTGGESTSDSIDQMKKIARYQHPSKLFALPE